VVVVSDILCLRMVGCLSVLVDDGAELVRFLQRDAFECRTAGSLGLLFPEDPCRRDGKRGIQQRKDAVGLYTAASARNPTAGRCRSLLFARLSGMPTTAPSLVSRAYWQVQGIPRMEGGLPELHPPGIAGTSRR
jgi:hypothetical protein